MESPAYETNIANKLVAGLLVSNRFIQIITKQNPI